MRTSSVFLLAVFAAALSVSAGSAAQRPSHDEERAKDSDICGYRLMTERERSQYRREMQAATSEAQRTRIRADHREQMHARARERGFALSCAKTPPTSEDAMDEASRDSVESRPGPAGPVGDDDEEAGRGRGPAR